MEKEIWKDIEGFEGKYQISSWGRVKSLERVEHDSWGRRYPINEKILKRRVNHDGYCEVVLCKNKIQKPYRVHRLVAQTFIPNPNNLPEVNHKNEIKDDNHVENLEWMTHRDNVNFGTRNQRAGKSISVSSKCKRIYQLSYDGSEIVNVWRSTAEVERILGYDNSNISECTRGKRVHHKGYRWQYADDMMKPFRENKEENTTQ